MPVLPTDVFSYPSSAAPTKPDSDIAKRYAGTFAYGFYMQKAEEEVFNIDAERWVVLNLNPKQITTREPFATSVAPTQGGGKVIESRGGILKMMSIAGETGFLPPSNKVLSVSAKLRGNGDRGALVDTSETAEEERAQRSGFLAFLKLRYLFRLYAYAKRRGATDVTMHYMDFKHDEFWRIEPEEFALNRSSNKPFLYPYSINFKVIEASDVFAAKSLDAFSAEGGVKISDLDIIRHAIPNIGDGLHPNTPLHAYSRRLTERLTGGLQYVKVLSGSVQQKFQGTLRDINNFVGFVEDIDSTLNRVIETPFILLKQLDNSVRGLMEVAHKFAPDDQLRELNDFAVEMRNTTAQLSSLLAKQVADRQGVLNLNSFFSRGRARGGSVQDLYTEPADGAGEPDKMPVVGANGLSLVTDVTALANVRALRSVPIADGDTIYTLAQKYIGNTLRFIDLIIINSLYYPYIVSDKSNKPSGTLAWGEYIDVPDVPTSSMVEPDAKHTVIPTCSGTVEELGADNELTDSIREFAWRTDQWIGYSVTLTHSNGDVEVRVVVSNTADTLTVNYDWDVNPAVGESYTITLELFTLRRKGDASARVFGRDLLLVFNRRDGSKQYGEVVADYVMNARGDLATVANMENFFQAMRIRMHTEQGRHPFHKFFGLPHPIGRPWSNDIRLLYTYFARRSFLQDPRVAQVRQPAYTLSGSSVSISVEVQPVRVRTSRKITITR